MKLDELSPTPVFDLYWEFAAKRQEIFFNKISGKTFPWTNDLILQKYKFTNAYRASDRVSQYLIRNVIYTNDMFSPEDVCFRILFFKLFNKIETWEYMENKLGVISYSTYSYEIYNQLLMNRIEEKKKIYSAAYIVPSGRSSFGYERKHQNNLRLLEYIMKSNLSLKIAKIKSLSELYEVLLSYPTLGSFLAFQFCIDINYSELCNYSEMSFVVAGPGARNGIYKCFGNIKNYKYEDVIKFVAENQESEFNKRGLKFKSLYGRRLQLIDCQNLFCETDKYARVMCPDIGGLNHRERIKQLYTQNNPVRIDYFYPPKWEINARSCT